MPQIPEAQLLQALQQVVDPNTGHDFVSTKQLRNLKLAGDAVSFDVELGYPAASQVDALRAALVAAARTVPGVGNVSVGIGSKIIAHAVQRGVQLLPGVKNIIVVASGSDPGGRRLPTEGGWEVSGTLATTAKGSSRS